MRILQRDAYTCQVQGCGARSCRQVDHEVPRAEGGSEDDSNLMTICDLCHARKSGREGARARQRRSA